MKRIIRVLPIFLILSIALSSCSKSTNTTTSNDIKNQKLVEELRQAQENLVLKDAEINSLKEAPKNEKTNVNAQAFPKREESLVYFPIYKTDELSKIQEVNSYVAIDMSLTVEEKILYLTNKLEKILNHDLEVKNINESNGKYDVIINLKDSEKFSWERDYFVDANHGKNRASDLLENYLQKEFQFDWLSSVKILVNGNNIKNESAKFLSKENKRIVKDKKN